MAVVCTYEASMSARLFLLDDGQQAATIELVRPVISRFAWPS